MCPVLLLPPTEKCWEELGGAGEAARQVRAGTKAWMAMAHPGTADSGVVAVPREAFPAPTHS